MSTKRAPFYSDMGQSTQWTGDDGSVMVVPRYGVWVWDDGRRKYGVAKVSDDLDELRATYGPGELVDMSPKPGPAA